VHHHSGLGFMVLRDIVSRRRGCTFKACGSMLFAPFKRPPEAEGFGSGFDDVGSIPDPVQHRL
jgi:hypothetical protein